MPRRRTGKKETPVFPSQILPDISVLLRDAQPIHAEIAGEPDPRKRRERERARRLATDYLVKIYNDAKKARRIQELDFDVRMFCEDLKKRNRGRLPNQRGGGLPLSTAVF